ncbi:glycosyltransferase family 39 protein, partial [bacterium]|nr:glycosyltransferase family 39 protein [bacterium]MBU1599700.1 glycosyltransferase family 39 protein [bacterium]
MAKFYITGRMVSVIFGVLSVLMVFLLARRIYGRNRALVSALLLAITPLFVIYTHTISTDIAMVFFVLLT